jgi:hypothetical protein
MRIYLSPRTVVIAAASGLVQNDERGVFVIPAEAGIQAEEALASGDASWIPGLASLARNDGRVRHSSGSWNPRGVMWVGHFVSG